MLSPSLRKAHIQPHRPTNVPVFLLFVLRKVLPKAKMAGGKNHRTRLQSTAKYTQIKTTLEHTRKKRGGGESQCEIVTF